MAGWNNLPSIEYPVASLEELHHEHGTEDGMTEAAVFQLALSLRDVGVSTECIEHYFTEVINKLKEEEQ